jgi:hypothetical protein
VHDIEGEADMLALLGFLLAIIDFTGKTEMLEQMVDRAAERFSSYVAKSYYRYKKKVGRIYGAFLSNEKQRELLVRVLAPFFVVLAAAVGLVIEDAVSGRDVLRSFVGVSGEGTLMFIIFMTTIYMIPFLFVVLFLTVELVILGCFYLLRFVLALLNKPKKGIVGTVGLIIAAVDLFASWAIQ